MNIMQSLGKLSISCYLYWHGNTWITVY